MPITRVSTNILGAHRYYGDFRTLDQSVDPKGQQYRVLIFTGYDGTAPYPYVKYGGYPSLPTPDGTSRWIPERYVPQQGTELTMCANPFIVQYEGDDINKYKTHRLSRASVSFIQTSLNEEFISTLGTSVLVVLLKRKNDVVEQGNSMVNLTTGATLSKVRIYDPFMEVIDREYFTIYYGYDWKDYEAFCYDVEWIGFSMPNTISCGFDHVKEVFTLECQDALSTLAYRNAVNVDADILSFKDLLTPYIQNLGCYDHIYVTRNIHLPDSLLTDSPGRCILENIITQIENYFDENGEPQKQLDVFDVVMNYLNLTLVPWKNSLIIYNPDCVQSGFMRFVDYALTRPEGNTEVFALPGGTYVSNITDVELSNQIILDAKSFSDSGTQISSGNVYDKAVVVCDEYHPDNILPDVENDDNLKEDIEDNHITFRFQGKASTADSPVYKYWECFSYRPIIESIKCYKYGVDSHTGNYAHTDIHWSTEQTEITDEDCKMQTMGTTTYPYWPNLWMKPACIVVDNNGAVTVSSNSEVPHSESYRRQFYFNSMSSEPWTMRKRITGQTSYYNYDNKTNYTQKLLYVRSKPVLFNGHQYINIKGKWEFYANGDRTDGRVAMLPTNDILGFNAGTRMFDPNNAFVYATVKCAGKYLNVTNRSTYTWQDTEVVTKLYLDNTGLAARADYCGKQFSFDSPITNLEGLFFRVPVDEGKCISGRVEIWFDRPLGPGGEFYVDGAPRPSLCNVSTLEDLEIAVTSDTYVETKGKTDPESDNTEYNTEIFTGAVEEYPQINLNLSSSDKRGLSYSETCVKRGSQLVITNRVYNDATSSFGIPEKIILDGVLDQHISPSIHLNMPLFRKCNITPVSRIRWGQLNGRDFLVDSMTINYEYETVDVNLMEMKESVHDDRDVNVVSRTRNYYRTDDIIFSGRVARRLREVVRNTADATRQEQTQLDIMGTNHAVMSSSLESEGVSRFVVDFQAGKLYLSTPADGVSAEVDDDGHLQVTVPTL